MQRNYTKKGTRAHQTKFFMVCVAAKLHCVKSVKIRSFFWSVFSCIRTEYGDLRSKAPYSVRILDKYGPKKTPYLDTFHAVNVIRKRRFKIGGNFRSKSICLKEDDRYFAKAHFVT